MHILGRQDGARGLSAGANDLNYRSATAPPKPLAITVCFWWPARHRRDRTSQTKHIYEPHNAKTRLYNTVPHCGIDYAREITPCGENEPSWLRMFGAFTTLDKSTLRHFLHEKYNSTSHVRHVATKLLEITRNLRISIMPTNIVWWMDVAAYADVQGMFIWSQFTSNSHPKFQNDRRLLTRYPMLTVNAHT